MPGINNCNKEASAAEDDLLEKEWNVWERKKRSVPTFSKRTISTGQLSTAEYYKIVRYSVKELQMSEYSHSKDKHFTFKENPFVFVYFSGTIVSVNTHKDKLCLEVHDGTASIKCLLEDKWLKNIEKEKNEIKEAIRTHNLQNENSSEIHQTTLMILQATQNLFRNIPAREEICTGNTIAIMGKLTEHNGTKYVFISKISKISIEDHMNNLEYCILGFAVQRNDECN